MNLAIRLTGAGAAVLLPMIPPVMLGGAVLVLLSAGTQQPAAAQGAEAVANVAKAITVRIEGATQGSGVLVRRDGNRYTVLTAWHVVSDQKPGEELDIYTPDGQRHQLEQGSIKRLGQVDLAVLTFTSSSSYEVARVGEVKSVSMGNAIYVAGFPLPSSAVPTRLLRFLKGDVIANATVTIPNGYQLLYSNPTLPGMSGGAVLNSQRQLVGIHGQAETDSKMSEQRGVAVKTGTNQAVPISYYSQEQRSTGNLPSSSHSVITGDDYLAQAVFIWMKHIEHEPTTAFDKYKGYHSQVMTLLEKTLKLSPGSSAAYGLLAKAEAAANDWGGTLSAATESLRLNPGNTDALFARARAKKALGDSTGAIADYSSVLKLDPEYGAAYHNRGILLYSAGLQAAACADWKVAANLGTKPSIDFLQSLSGLWCRNMP